MKQRPAAIFFDLDGTLADTASDLATPVNQMRIERGLAALPVSDLRQYASMGARGLLGKALGVTPAHTDFDSLRADFLRRYERHMCEQTTLFNGVDVMLDALDAAGMPWGIVSNKAERYVRPICHYLGLAQRSKTLIGGDTTAFAKPHPEPLLHAARMVGVTASRCLYVGDDKRDIEAAHAAGMRSVAAAYGYCGNDSAAAVNLWGADFTVSQPELLLASLGLELPVAA
jgi:N-acetyl-D-muramate 6-phosphate phosphatase